MKGGHQGALPPELREEAKHGSPSTPRKIEQVWHLLGRLEADTLNIPDTETAWADLQQRLDVPVSAPASVDRTPSRNPGRRRPRGARLSLSVAALMVVLVAGIGLWQQPVEVVVARGEQHLVTLPDGSTVHLNSDSRLRYRRGFQAWPFVAAAQRVVAFEGEAFFEVVHTAKPFVVETFNGQVEVLGTQFNVRARQGLWEDETRVTLASGRVRVTAYQNEEDAVLLTEPGQGARIHQTTLRPDSSALQQTLLQRVLSWRDQEFSFIDKPLAFVLAEIERRFDLSIEAEVGLALADSVTLFYPRGATADKILHDLCLAQHCRYRETSGGFAVFPAER